MKNKAFVFTIGISLIVFILLTLLTVTNNFLFDDLVNQWASGVSSPLLLGLMKLISMIGSSESILLITVIITAIFLIKKKWSHCLFFLTLSVGGVVLNFLLKMLIHRGRPGDVASNIDVFNISLEIPSYSFPSGHAMRSTILFLFLLFIIYRFIKNEALKLVLYSVCIVLALSVALSRIMLDFHFFSDVIAAISISIVWFCFCLLIFKPFEKRNRGLYRF